MKKAVTAACTFLCTAFLWACAIGQDGKTDLEDVEGEKAESNEIVSGETVVSDDGQTADIQDIDTDINEQNTLSAVQMQGLLQGNLGGIGLGLLTYTLPQQDGEDYRLCFFKEGGQEPDFGQSMSEAVYYPLEMADYIFPDVRENNVPIGKFMEIYFFDTITIGEDSTAGLAVVAAYDVKGETCYDTRIYRWDGNVYSAEGKLMQEFNEKYHNKEEYPVEELYHLSVNEIAYYSAVTDRTCSEVERYAVRVKQLFLEHDWAAISTEISYPITISDITYSNSADFLDASNSFDNSLEEAFFTALEKEDCTEMFCNWEGIMLGETGQIWISEVLDAESNSHGLKIIAVNGMLK
ncbi:MAG: hypothetical protein K2J99_10810 [Lachnospiraceae bacterium]|nr:hypothetical protein [Lachnospiraceae bacterium]